MAIGTEVDFDYINKRIHRHASATAAIHTVNEMYSYMQTVFDELAQMDDKIPMSAATPTSYKMINGWYLEEEVVRHLDGGAIETTGYLNEIHVLDMDGTYTPFIASDIGKQVTDDAAEVGALLDYDNTAQKIWVRIGSATVIADNSAIAVTAGTGAGDALLASRTGETLFANPYTLGTLFTTLPLYIIQDSIELTSWWADGHFDILVKVMEASVDIDSRKVTAFGRKWLENYTHFNITLTAAGQNAIPLGTSDDLNVTNTEVAVQALADTNIGGDLGTGIDINFLSAGYSYDIGDGNGAQTYNIQIDCNGQRLADVYEVTKWATRDSSTSQLVNYQDLNGDTPDDGQEYISYNSTWAEVVSAPFGSFAGGQFFGARGVYFTNLHADDAQSFQLIDTAGITRNPPNFQAFSMSGLLAGDNVTVYESTGAASTTVKKDQYNLSGANALNTITVSVAIPSSTPETGYIIVVDDDNTEIHYAYSAWSGSDFTVVVSAALYAGTETAYVAFLYGTSVAGEDVNDTTTIYTTPINVVGSVRQAGYLPYEAAGTYSASGYSGSAIRTADGIYV